MVSILRLATLMGVDFTVVVANVAIWCFRFWCDTPGVKHDLLWLLRFSLWAFRLNFLSFLRDGDYSMPSVAVICALLISFTNGVGLSDWIIRTSEHEDYETASDPQAMRPLVFPCRTSHTRIFPKKHSFSYSYLFVGIPIGWRGSVGSFLSADLNSLAPKTEQSRPVSKSWFSVEAEDHLTRKTHISGLLGKLEAYLKSQVGLRKTASESTLLNTRHREKFQRITPLHTWLPHLDFLVTLSTLSLSGICIITRGS